MHLESLFDPSLKNGISGLFHVDCSCGRVDGCDAATYTADAGSCIWEVVRPNFRVRAVIQRENGLYHRRDTFTNTGTQPLTLYRYDARFTLHENTVQVYSQNSNWCNENDGQWQPLVNAVSIRNQGARATAGAAPFAALWRGSAQRGLALHVLANAAWQITVTRRPFSPGICNVVVLEAGICPDELHMLVAPGETITLPEILFYEFDNQTDLGAQTLHTWCAHNLPAPRLPVIYNSWFSNFDRLNFSDLDEQARMAAELGFEYFVIDAGWFGNGGMWCDLIGDWRENTTGALCGRMRELADRVRDYGMQFGLWLEPERALANAPIVQQHPEYFIQDGENYFLDFSNDEARAYITALTCQLAQTYGVALFKFDFNADCQNDPSGSAFYRYHAGHRRYIEALRAAIPGVYLENCASGGARADLYRCTYLDGIWFTDNQNPQAGIHILRGAVLRLPPARLERWVVLKGADCFPDVYAKGNSKHRLLTVQGATWQTLENISPEYVRQFLTGGALGVSCNLHDLGNEDLDLLRAQISAHKQLRGIFAAATCTILTANDDFTVWQYATPDESAVILQAFAHRTYQDVLTLYPKLRCNQRYSAHSASELMENGITVQLDPFDRCAQCILHADA